MNKFTLLFIFLSSFVSAQDILIPHEKDGKWGYISSETKEVVVPYQYNMAKRFIDQTVAKVKLGNRWGLLSREGKELLPFEYTRIEKLRRKILKIFDGTHWKIVNLEGKEISETGYTLITNMPSYSSPEPALIYVSKGDRMGIIDEKGNVILPCNFESVKSEIWSIKPTQTPKLFPVKNNEKWGYAKKGGEVVIPFQFEAVSFFKERVAIAVKENDYFLIDDKGNLMSDKGFNKIINFNPILNHAVVINEHEKYGVINSKGEEIIPFIYDNLELVYGKGQRFYHAKLNDKYGIINHKGEIVASIVFASRIRNWGLGMISDWKSTLRGLDGKILLKEQYDNVRGYQENYFEVEKNGKVGLVDILTEKIIVPLEYSDIVSPIIYRCPFDYFVAQKGEKVGLVDQFNNIILPFEYESIRPHNSLNVLLLRKDGKEALADLKGKLITGFEYEKIMHDTYSPFRAKKNGKWGYINTEGKIIYPFELEEVGSVFNEYTFNNKQLFNSRGLFCNSSPIPDTVQLQAAIQISGKYFWLSTDGKIREKQPRMWRNKIKPSKREITPNTFATYDPTSRLLTLVDENGEKILPHSFSDIDLYHGDGFIPFKIKRGKEGYYLPFAKKEVEYDRVDRYPVTDAPIRWVSNGQKYGFINSAGEEVTPLHFEKVGVMYGGMISVSKDGKTGFLDESGAMKIPMKFDFDGNYSYFENGVTYAYLNGKYGFINLEGETIAPFEYEAIAYFREGVAIAYRNGKWEKLEF